MIRTLRSAALLLTVPAALGLSVAAVSPAAAAVHPAAGCSTAAEPIAIDGFAFTPPQVFPDNSSTADLITTNCTGATLISTETWTGRWLPLSTSGAAPAGCPAIDPVTRSVTYAAGQELAENGTYTVPTGCQAAELAVTVDIGIDNAGDVESATAYLVIEHISPGA
ncbi:hypothetical protein KDL01_36145 [Actinospica durhamensis]|uniref:Secreted protein n=1 Tax=Actinospica durhamensis TaxID=1508375 RepID=A0A941EWX0_9ACTN|nr:hypothetical protein [Actinospica durhamensis]MBR7838756.1 hypothetical protein [Actinospica durhamensis]